MDLTSIAAFVGVVISWVLQVTSPAAGTFVALADAATSAVAGTFVAIAAGKAHDTADSRYPSDSDYASLEIAGLRTPVARPYHAVAFVAS